MSTNELKQLIFHMKVPSLKEMCCYAIGLEYLRGEVAKCNSSKVRLFCCYNGFDGEKCIHYMNAYLRVNLQMERIPNHVKEMVDQYVESLKVEIEDWLNYHFDQVFWFHSRYHHASAAVAYLNDLIWLPNGTIGYTETARKLLCNNELTESEKYGIACAYCFEEEIYILGPLYYMNLSNEEIADHNDFMDLFWYERVQKKISNEELPAIDYDRHITNGLLQSPSYKNWWVIKYFLNNLQSDEVVNLARNACCTDLCAMQMLYWLPTLSGALAHEVLNACGHMLVRRLIRHPKYSMQTFEIWSCIKSTISESLFLNLISRIHLDNVYTSRYSRSDDCTVILYNEILRSTPDELKYPALGCLTDTYLSSTFNYHRELRDINQHIYMEFPRDFRMIFVMLLNASFEHRNTFWNNNWKNLLWASTPFHLNELMRLCFYDEMEIIKFKESDLIIYDNIKDYCINLLQNGKFTELDIFLNFCSSNEQTVFDLRRKIMDDPLRLSNSAKQYKDGECLVQYASPFCSQFEFVQNVLNDNELLMAQEFVILFSSSEQDLRRWKKILVESLYTHLVEKSFTKIISLKEWIFFTDWLFANVEKVLEFKKSLPMGEIFVGSLLSRSPDKLHEEGFSFMGNFLAWYFMHPETAKNYWPIKNCFDLSMQEYFEVCLNAGYIPTKKQFGKLKNYILKDDF